MVQKRDDGNVLIAMDWKAYVLAFVLFIIEFIVLVWLPWMYGIPASLSDTGWIFLIVAAVTFVMYIYMQDRKLQRAMRG